MIYNNLGTLYKSKRESFYELGGELKISTIRGDKLVLIDSMKNSNNIKIDINSLKYNFVIDSFKNVFKFKNKKINENFKTERYIQSLQSNITYKIISDLLKNGNCQLTPIKDSYFIHKPLLMCFLIHFNKILKLRLTKCPIT